MRVRTGGIGICLPHGVCDSNSKPRALFVRSFAIVDIRVVIVSVCLVSSDLNVQRLFDVVIARFLCVIIETSSDL